MCAQAQRERSGAELWRHIVRRLTLAAAISNGLGGLALFLLLGYLLPFAPPAADKEIGLNAAVGLAYLAIVMPLGKLWSIRMNRPLERWMRRGGPPDPEARRLALRQPLQFALISATFWAIGAVLFTLLNVPGSGWPALVVGGAIAMGGEMSCAMGYLMAERIVRPVTALALAGGPPPEPGCLGVDGRLMTAWSVGTGIPLFGIGVIGVAGLANPDVELQVLVGGVVFLVAVGSTVGMLAMRMAARSIADPVRAVRKAMARIEEGDLDATVPVDDGSEIGMLEAGFNRMAAGMRERDRLRDLFGRHVGREVAEAALERDGEPVLGGEQREVGALLVDLIGSTSLASRRPPGEVVALLNSFFRLVVEVVEEHGGCVNKFEGDAALCLFGAPVSRPDPAGDALRAARDLRERITHELPADAGIGVSAGPAFAGYVGAEERFEYTVIGDPVNEAARLCDLAKRRPERLLAADAALTRAAAEESARWQVSESVLLRGRSVPTGLALPVAAGGGPHGPAALRSRFQADRSVLPAT